MKREGKMKRFKSILAAAIMVVATAATYTLPTSVGAQSAQSSSSLSIVPRKNYVVEQGKSVKDTLVIRNLDGSQPLDLTLRVVDFTYTDDGGTPKLLLDQNAPQTTWSLKPFLTVPESVTIPAGGSKTIDMSVAIPANQGAGSYYSAIVYSSGAGDGGNVALSASGTTLVFASVPGSVNEDLKLKKLGAYDTNPTSPGFTFFAINKPYNIGYTLQNNGNVTESPAGQIVLKSMFGQTITVDNINVNSSLALIGQSRTFTTCIKVTAQTVNFDGDRTNANTCVEPDLWPGVYNVSLSGYYGQNGNETKQFEGSAYFVYLPVWALIILAVLILVIAFLIWRLVVRIRRARGYRR